jgi:hypothetical protein
MPVADAGQHLVLALAAGSKLLRHLTAIVPDPNFSFRWLGTPWPQDEGGAVARRLSGLPTFTQFQPHPLPEDVSVIPGRSLTIWDAPVSFIEISSLPEF